LRNLIELRDSASYAELPRVAGADAPSQPSESCPDPGDWLRLTLGEISPSGAREMLAHSSLCTRCAGQLRLALEIRSEQITAEEDAELTALQSVAIADRPRLAETLARTPHRPFNTVR
jgi:hypothetical protein